MAPFISLLLAMPLRMLSPGRTRQARCHTIVAKADLKGFGSAKKMLRPGMKPGISIDPFGRSPDEQRARTLKHRNLPLLEPGRFVTIPGADDELFGDFDYDDEETEPVKPKSRNIWAAEDGFDGVAKLAGVEPGEPFVDKAFMAYARALTQFQNRYPVNADIDCPCGSGASYKTCCRPYHLDERQPESPERCLRTRYTAYVYRLIEYIIRTTHEKHPDYKDDKLAWARLLNLDMFDTWELRGLEVGESEDASSDDEQFLHFKVKLKESDDDDDVAERYQDLRTMAERAHFLKTREGNWLYASGESRVDWDAV